MSSFVYGYDDDIGGETLLLKETGMSRFCRYEIGYVTPVGRYKTVSRRKMIVYSILSTALTFVYSIYQV